MSNRSSDPREILNDPTMAFLQKISMEQVIDLHGQVAITQVENALAQTGEILNPDNFQMVFDRISREYLLVYVPEVSGPLIVELPARVIKERALIKMMSSLASSPLDCNDPTCPEHGHGGKKPHELN